MGCWCSSVKPPQQANVAHSPFTSAAGIAAARTSAVLPSATAKSSTQLADQNPLLRSHRDLLDPCSNVNSACSTTKDASVRVPVVGIQSARDSLRQLNASTGCCPPPALLTTMTSSHRQLQEADFEDHVGVEEEAVDANGELLCAVATLAVDLQEVSGAVRPAGPSAGPNGPAGRGGDDESGNGSDSCSDILKSSRHLLQNVVPLLLNPAGGIGAAAGAGRAVAGASGAAPRVPAPLAPPQTGGTAQPSLQLRPAAAAGATTAEGHQGTATMGRRPTFIRGLTKDSFLLNNTTTGGTTACSGYMLRTATGRGELLHADAHWRPFQMGNPLQVQIGELLGRGGCGTVYHGQWRGRPVAVKVVQQVIAAPAGAVPSAGNVPSGPSPSTILTPLIDYFGSSSGVSGRSPAVSNMEAAAAGGAPGPTAVAATVGAAGVRAPYLPDAHASVKRLRHPNVLRTYAYAILSTAPQLGGVLPSRHEHHVVLELCDGGSLRGWLDELYRSGSVEAAAAAPAPGAAAVTMAAAQRAREFADKGYGAAAARAKAVSAAAPPPPLPFRGIGGAAGVGGAVGIGGGADPMAMAQLAAKQALERAQAHLDSRWAAEPSQPSGAGPPAVGSMPVPVAGGAAATPTSSRFAQQQQQQQCLQAAQQLLQQLQHQQQQLLQGAGPLVPAQESAVPAAAATCSAAPACIDGPTSGRSPPAPTAAAAAAGEVPPRQASTMASTSAWTSVRGRSIGTGSATGTATETGTQTGDRMVTGNRYVSAGQYDGSAAGASARARAAGLEPSLPSSVARKESHPGGGGGGGGGGSGDNPGLEHGRTSVSEAISHRLRGLTPAQSEQLQLLGMEWVSDSQVRLDRLTSGGSAGKVGGGAAGGDGASGTAGAARAAGRWMTNDFAGSDDEGVAVSAVSEPSMGAAVPIGRLHTAATATATTGASTGVDVGRGTSAARSGAPLRRDSFSCETDGGAPRMSSPQSQHSPPPPHPQPNLTTSIQSEGSELWVGAGIHAYANGSMGSAGGSTMVRPESSSCMGYQAVQQQCVVLDDDLDDDVYDSSFGGGAAAGDDTASDGRIARGESMYDASGSTSGHVHGGLFGTLRLHERLALLEEGSGEGQQSSPSRASRCDSIAATASTVATNTTPTDTTTAAEANALQRHGTHASAVSSSGAAVATIPWSRVSTGPCAIPTAAGGAEQGPAVQAHLQPHHVERLSAFAVAATAATAATAAVGGSRPVSSPPPLATHATVPGTAGDASAADSAAASAAAAAAVPRRLGPSPGAPQAPPLTAAAGTQPQAPQQQLQQQQQPQQPQQQQPLHGEFEGSAVTALLNRRAMGMVNSILRAAAASGGAASEPMSGPQLRHLVSALGCLVEIASGLSYLHSVGMVHGDIKSGNVLLKLDPRHPRGFVLKLADFGFSRVLEHGSYTYLSRPSGTLAYLSPEMLTSYRQSSAADLYAFGLLAWEVVTTQPLFRGLQTPQLLYAKTHNADWQYLPWPAWCPPEVRVLARRCAEFHPAERLTAAEARAQLEALRSQYQAVLARSAVAGPAEGSGTIATAAPSGPPPLPPPPLPPQ